MKKLWLVGGGYELNSGYPEVLVNPAGCEEYMSTSVG